MKKIKISLLVVLFILSSMLVTSCGSKRAETKTIITKGKFIESTEVDRGEKYTVYNTKIQLEDGTIYEYDAVNQLIMNNEIHYVSQKHPDNSDLSTVYLIEVHP